MAANEDIFASSGPLTLCLSAFAMVVQFLVISVSVNNDSYYADPVRLFTVPPSSLFTQRALDIAQKAGRWTGPRMEGCEGRGDFLTHHVKSRITTEKYREYRMSMTSLELYMYSVKLVCVSEYMQFIGSRWSEL